MNWLSYFTLLASGCKILGLESEPDPRSQNKPRKNTYFQSWTTARLIAYTTSIRLSSYFIFHLVFFNVYQACSPEMENQDSIVTSWSNCRICRDSRCHLEDDWMLKIALMNFGQGSQFNNLDTSKTLLWHLRANPHSNIHFMIREVSPKFPRSEWSFTFMNISEYTHVSESTDVCFWSVKQTTFYD